jgi:hypothetical protein
MLKFVANIFIVNPYIARGANDLCSELSYAFKEEHHDTTSYYVLLYALL